MPVKLVSVDDPSNAMVITLDDYNTGRKNFAQHYFLADCNSDFGGQDIRVSWASFYKVVEGYIAAYSLDPTTVALRFVYAYNETNVALGLRMQLCTMVEDEATPGTFNLITKQSEWYSLNDESVPPAQDPSLKDPHYLQNLYYCETGTCTADTCENLAADKPDTKYARNVTFPWAEEILQMYADNKQPGDGYLCFGACSYVNGGSGDAPILYPHGMVMYLEDASGTPLLDNDDTIVMFHNKGCDMGTLCPPTCNVYILPADDTSM